MVDENLLFVAHAVGERYVAVGEQHFGLLLVGEVESVFRDAGDREFLRVSGFEHAAVILWFGFTGSRPARRPSGVRTSFGALPDLRERFAQKYSKKTKRKNVRRSDA